MCMHMYMHMHMHSYAHAHAHAYARAHAHAHAQVARRLQHEISADIFTLHMHHNESHIAPHSELPGAPQEDSIS